MDLHRLQQAIEKKARAEGFGPRSRGELKKASLDLSVQRGVALAKAAMADPKFASATKMMGKEPGDAPEANVTKYPNGAISAHKRESLKTKQFAVPASKARKIGVTGEIKGEAKGKYPIHDIKHARNALARVSQYGTPAERQAVRSKVYSRYPELREDFEQRHGESPTSKKNIKKEEQGRVGLKKSAGSQSIQLKTAAERGAALAKAAMADSEFAGAAEMMSKEGSFWKNVAVGTAGLALAPLAYGVGQMGIGAVQKAYESLTEGKQKAKAYSDMMKVHKKNLGSEDRSKIQTAFNSLWGLNPDMAKDPLVSGTYVTKALDYGGVTTQEASQLIQARKGMGEARAHEKWVPDSKAMDTGVRAFSSAPGMIAD